ncbi:MAG: hypothetical protein H7Y13_11915 [Sphingobacteriaceae bacterium]|nr:hypothetical protein [Sphingobacteriaceae bacterium]
MKHLILSFKTVAWLAMSFLFGAFCATAAGAPGLATETGLVFAAFNFIPQGNLNASLFTITAADVIAEWGAYYRAEGQGVKDIMTRLMQRSVTASYFPTRITDKTVMEKVSAEFTRVLQRFQKAFTPIGGVTFEPLKIPLGKLKIDLQETPDDLEESWLGFLGDNSLDRREWPYTKWWLMNALIQADKDLELTEIYFGDNSPAIVPGTATAAGKSILGIKKQINALNTAGKLELIALGAVPATGLLMVDYVETMIKEIPRLLRNELDFVFMQEDLHDLFRDGMEEKHNTNYAKIDESKITKLKNDNIRVVGLPSMVGSNKIWTTPSWNRQGGLKKPKNQQIFEVEKVDRTVKAYTDYYKGYGFWIGEYVCSNDVELV